MNTRRMLLPFALLSVLGVVGINSYLKLKIADEFDPFMELNSLCSVERPFNAEGGLGEPKKRLDVAVSANNPVPGKSEARVFEVAKDDVIQIEVSSPRAGGVAVHGLMDTHAVRIGNTVAVKLRAKYTGRFPLHFHGDDGSHFEIAVFEIR